MASLALAGCGGGTETASEKDEPRAVPTVTATAAQTPPVAPTTAADPAASAQAQPTVEPTPAAEPEGREAPVSSSKTRPSSKPPTPRVTPTATPRPTSQGPRTLTHAQAIARGDRICRQYGRDLEQLSRPEDEQAREVYYGEAAALAEKAVLRLERLRVPDARRRTFARYIELLWRNVELLEELQQGLRDGDVQVEQRVAAKATADGRRAARLARRYGFKVCGGDAG